MAVGFSAGFETSYWFQYERIFSCTNAVFTDWFYPCVWRFSIDNDLLFTDEKQHKDWEQKQKKQWATNVTPSKEQRSILIILVNNISVTINIRKNEVLENSDREFKRLTVCRVVRPDGEHGRRHCGSWCTTYTSVKSSIPCWTPAKGQPLWQFTHNLPRRHLTQTGEVWKQHRNLFTQRYSQCIGRVCEVERQVKVGVKTVTNTVGIFIARNTVWIGTDRSTGCFHFIRPGVVVVIKVLNQRWRAGRFTVQGVRHAVTIAVNGACRVEWEHIWSSGTAAIRRYLWSIAHAITIAVSVHWGGSSIVLIHVGWGVCFNIIQQAIAVDVIIQCVADGISIKVWDQWGRIKWVSFTIGFFFISEAVTVIVQVFGKTTQRIVIKRQLIRHSIWIWIFKHSYLDDKHIIEQTAVGIDGVVFQRHSNSWCAPDGSIAFSDEKTIRQIWTDCIDGTREGWSWF